MSTLLIVSTILGMTGCISAFHMHRLSDDKDKITTAVTASALSFVVLFCTFLYACYALLTGTHSSAMVHDQL